MALVEAIHRLALFATVDCLLVIVFGLNIIEFVCDFLETILNMSMYLVSV